MFRAEYPVDHLMCRYAHVPQFLSASAALEWDRCSRTKVSGCKQANKTWDLFTRWRWHFHRPNTLWWLNQISPRRGAFCLGDKSNQQLTGREMVPLKGSEP